MWLGVWGYNRVLNGFTKRTAFALSENTHFCWFPDPQTDLLNAKGN